MERRLSESSARGGRAAKKDASAKRRIDYSDIPELTTKQLRSMRRVGRPPAGRSAKRLIAFRIDPKLLRQLEARAKSEGIGYQTLMHEILSRSVRRTA